MERSSDVKLSINWSELYENKIHFVLICWIIIIIIIIVVVVVIIIIDN